MSSKMEITVLLPELVSLHELIYAVDRDYSNIDEGLNLRQKMYLLMEIAKIVGQLHRLGHPYAHGSLNSHNVFVELGSESEKPKVLIGELEMCDFKRYANMFYDYQSISVYSAPECLCQPKKYLDPTWQMDVYSFGVLMWELLHEK